MEGIIPFARKFTYPRDGRQSFKQERHGGWKSINLVHRSTQIHLERSETGLYDDASLNYIEAPDLPLM